MVLICISLMTSDVALVEARPRALSGAQTDPGCSYNRTEMHGEGSGGRCEQDPLQRSSLTSAPRPPPPPSQKQLWLQVSLPPWLGLSMQHTCLGPPSEASHFCLLPASAGLPEAFCPQSKLPRGCQTAGMWLLTARARIKPGATAVFTKHVSCAKIVAVIPSTVH